MPKIYNLSLLLFLSSDSYFLKTGHHASFLLEFVEKHVAAGLSLGKISCCTWGNKELFLVIPQKLRSSYKMSSIMLRKTHLNVSKIIIFAVSSLDSLFPLQ